MNIQNLPPGMADKIIETMIKAGSISFLMVDGASMEPFLKNQSKVLVDHRVGQVLPGDIVLFERKGEKGRFLHRVIDVDGDIITTKGDSRISPDKPITRENILGVVTATEDPHRGRTYINREPYVTLGQTIARLSRQGGLLFRQSMDETTGDDHAAQECHRRGYSLYREGKIEEALSLFRQALAHDPSRALSRVNAGEILRQLNRPHEALIQLGLALDLDLRRSDVSAQAYNIRGNTLTDMQCYQESLEEYNSCLSISPEFVPALVNRGWAYQMIGDYSSARTDLEKALELEPENLKAKKYLGGLYLLMEEILPARTHLESALKTCPDDPDILNNLGLTYLKTGKTKRAGDYFDRAISVNPRHIEALFNQGRLMEKTSSVKEALSYFHKILKSFPENREIQGEIARLARDISAGEK